MRSYRSKHERCQILVGEVMHDVTDDVLLSEGDTQEAPANTQHTADLRQHSVNVRNNLLRLVREQRVNSSLVQHNTELLVTERHLHINKLKP